MKKLRVLLLGADGQLGTDITNAFRQADPPDTVELEPLCLDDLDVTHFDEIPKVLGRHTFDALINCTSYHKTDELETHAQRAFDTNAFAVRALADQCRTRSARLVHISTDYVFDGQAGRAYCEVDAPGPLSVYGASKITGESLAQTSHNDVVILRVASLFGVAGALGKGGNFVETMIRVGRERKQLRVVSDQVMSPTSTADVAWMILRALEKDIPAGIYHAVNSGQASWYAFACRIIERAGVEATVDPIPATEYPVPARRPAFSVLDNRKLAGYIGPIPHWHDALDRYLVAKGHRAER